MCVFGETFPTINTVLLTNQIVVMLQRLNSTNAKNYKNDINSQ